MEGDNGYTAASLEAGTADHRVIGKVSPEPGQARTARILGRTSTGWRPAGQVRVSAWVPAATLDALGSLARTAKTTTRALLARLIEDAARRQLELMRLKAVTRG